MVVELEQFIPVLVGEDTINVTGTISPCAVPFAKLKVEFCVFDIPSPPKSHA